MDKEELDLHIAFAHLELLEVRAGQRLLANCPGVVIVAKAI